MSKEKVKMMKVARRDRTAKTNRVTAKISIASIGNFDGTSCLSD